MSGASWVGFDYSTVARELVKLGFLSKSRESVANPCWYAAAMPGRTPFAYSTLALAHFVIVRLAKTPKPLATPFEARLLILF